MCVCVCLVCVASFALTKIPLHDGFVNFMVGCMYIGHNFVNKILFYLGNFNKTKMKKYPQRARDDYTTSHQRRCSVMTLHRR